MAFLKLAVISLMCLLVSPIHSRTIESDPSICQSCREVVGFVKRLTDLSDQSELQANLTRWCRESGNGANDKVCSYYVVDGWSAVARLGSDHFCEKVQACPNEDGVQLDVPLDSSALEDTSCDFCVNTVTHVREILASKQTEQEMKSVAVQACKHVGSLRDECTHVLDENLDNIFKFIRNQLNPQAVCTSMGFCRSSANNKQAERPPTIDDFVNILPVENDLDSVPFVKLTPARRIVGDDEAIEYSISQGVPISIEVAANPMDCLLCKQVAGWVMHKLKDNKTEVAVVEALDQVCDRLFSAGKRLDCEQFVKSYAHEAIQFIIQEDDPKTVCQLLGVCHRRQPESSQPADDEMSIYKDCWSCLTAADYVLKRSSVDPVEGAVDEVCERVLPTDPDCPSYIADNKQDIIEMFEKTNHIQTKEVRSATVCSGLGLCPWKESVPLAIEKDESESEVTPRSLPTCYVCKRILKYVNRQIGSNRSEAAIDAALSDVCHVLLDVRNCHAKITEWRDDIVKAVQTASDTELACDLLGVCQVQPEVPATNKSVCYECQSMAHFIQAELNDYKTEKEVDDFVIDNICSKATLPTVRDTCNSFVTEYGPSIMQMVAMKMFDPKVICERDLRICPPKPAEEPPSADFEFIRPRAQATCDACIRAVTELDQLLSVEQIDKEIAKVAAKVCSRVRADRRRQCVTIVEAFGPYFLQVIGRLNNPEAVCRSVDLCSTRGHVQLLGGHKCTFGPTYWCHSIAHANACKATDYCRNTEWIPVQ